MNRLNSQNLVPMLAALRVAAYHHGCHRDATPPGKAHRPFITISRQAGAGGRSFARQLAKRLNEIDRGELPWTVWDNELVERVASEYHLRASTVAAFEDQPPSWLEEALTSLALGSGGARPDELTLYHRVAATIRALAEIGRVVIVGRGSSFITRDMPGGVHVRLVAPQDFRVAATANSMGIASFAAAEWVRQTDRNREAFYRRHWPDLSLIPENFTATFNTAAVPNDRLVDCVLRLIPTTSGGSSLSKQTGVPVMKGAALC